MFTQGHMNCTMFDFTEALKEEERYKIRRMDFLPCTTALLRLSNTLEHLI